MCCVLDGNIHIFSNTQRAEPYQTFVWIPTDLAALTFIL